MKQPLLGIVSTALVCVISLGLISLFDFPTFSGWVSYFLLCVIPMQIVMLALWRTEHPHFAAAHRQPAKGIFLTLLAMVWGGAVAAAYFVMIGGSIGPPTPMLNMCAIVTVPITFWLCIVWGGWPSNAVIRNPIAAGLVQVIGGYVLNYALFRTFFNYAFMEGAPVYVASLDPHGFVNAWKALVFWLASALLSVTFPFLVFYSDFFNFWPFKKE